MKNFIKRGLLLSTFIAFFSISCDRKDIENPQATGSLQSENRYLEFKDFSTFQDKLKEIQKKSPDELVSWESSVNFTTLHRSYEQIMKDELASVEKAEALVRQGVSPKDIKLEKSLLRQELGKMLIETSLGTEINLFDPAYAKLLNKDGVVKIGVELYKFGSDNVKVIKDGDYSHIAFLDNVSEKNQTPNLKYLPVKVSNQPLRTAKMSASDFSCSNETGGYRVDGWVRSYYWETGNSWGGYQYSYVAFMKSTHRRWSRAWGWVTHNTNIYRTFGNYALTITNNTSWANMGSNSSGSFDMTNYGGTTANAFYYFVPSTTGQVPSGTVGPYPDITLSGTFNFEFYDCKCTATN
ncbi:MAG: hypothetical protein EAZ29_02335 [Runella slithyformis]|nr:MAG: hypothetical protein EAZ29_02335 [Runella slithyformis]